MRRSKLALALAITLFGMPAASQDAMAPEAADMEAATDEVPPELAEVAILPEDESAAPEDQAQAASNGSVELGPMGRDETGRVGRIHVVASGDTLWDISDAYLGTPWVWPSVWNDNGEIENPHVIHPGDRIWITPEEMRRISEEEAARLMAGAEGLGDMPANYPDGSLETERTVYTFAQIDETGFVTKADLDGSATILDSPLSRKWLEQFTTVVIGYGEGEVSVGDQFEVFRPGQAIAHPETKRHYGYHTEQLGWLEVTRVGAESSEAIIRYSRTEMKRGDHLKPREVRDPEIEVLTGGPEVEGQIVYAPSLRLEYGSNDVVYLDRGTSHGLQVGHPMEVYRPVGKGERRDAVKGEVLTMPDFVVAKLLVVSANEDASVAVVTYSSLDIQQGDMVRTSDSIGVAEPN